MIRHNLKTALMAATATASLALTGCAGGLGIGGSKTASASDAAEARADGKTEKAVTLAEQAVLAAPRGAAAQVRTWSEKKKNSLRAAAPHEQICSEYDPRFYPAWHCEFYKRARYSLFPDRWAGERILLAPESLTFGRDCWPTKLII